MHTVLRDSTRQTRENYTRHSPYIDVTLSTSVLKVWLFEVWLIEVSECSVCLLPQAYNS